MTRSKFNIVIYVAFGAATLALLYVLNQNQALKHDLEHHREADAHAVQSPGDRKRTIADSLLAYGDYSSAIQLYHQLLTDSMSDARQIDLHLMIVKKLINERRTDKKRVADSATMAEMPAVVTDRSALPDEQRKYDSLIFALQKAHRQLDRLKHQQMKKDYGEYLAFESIKGNTVHYVGQVKDDKANGRGVGLLNTGSRYVGEWVNNQKHGKGVFYWADGQYYEGDYKEDKRHGYGTYHWPNGEKFAGYWANNERNGEGVFYGEEGNVLARGIWKNDELVEKK